MPLIFNKDLDSNLNPNHNKSYNYYNIIPKYSIKIDKDNLIVETNHYIYKTKINDDNYYIKLGEIFEDFVNEITQLHYSNLVRQYERSYGCSS